MEKDTIICLLSDMHSGGTTALFPHYKKLPLGFWQFKNNRYTPSGNQCDLFDHYDKCVTELAKRRKDKRLIIIHDGDAVDGDHHYTQQIVSQNMDEQVDVHLWLMNYLFKKTGYAHNRGDKLYYISGTEAHTDDKESRIAKELNAEQNAAGEDVHDFLPIEICGRLLWFLHHGAGAGRGYLEGDALRNWLKKIYWERDNARKTIPDMIIMGHVHRPVYSSYVHNYKTIHGIILPAWQTKTRFGYMVAPTEVNKIGMHIIEIKADGAIVIPPPLIMEVAERVIRI